MEIADVRKQILRTIERAKLHAAERRARGDEAGRAYSVFLDVVAVPIFRQVANVLRAENYPFSVFTPSGSVRLMSDRGTEDFIELTLETTGEVPQVVGRTSRSRGGRVLESERALGGPAALTEHDVLDFLTRELDPFVDR
jgi:hypothetical protein